MASTRTITGTLLDENGAAWTSQTITFVLQTDFATTATDTVLNKTVTATTSAEDGTFSVALAVPDADAWQYRCSLPDKSTFVFNLEAGVATTLHAIMASANLSATVSASTLSNYIHYSEVLDEDDMASDSATAVASQQSIKAYVDAGDSAPAAHAASHTDGTDDIQDATAAQKGLATATQITKLDGIEALADVTDTTNVDAAGAVMEADYDANTILAATADNTPAALTVAEQTVVGRITAGAITALTATQIRTLINVEDGADVTDATNVASAGALMTTGGTMAGAIAMADNEIQRAVLKDVGEAGETDATSTATKTLDIAAEGNNFDITLDNNCTLTFSNPSASGTWCWISLILRQDGTGSRTVTWPGSVEWGDAGEPTLKTGAGDYDIFAFMTVDAGTTWIATAVDVSGMVEKADYNANTILAATADDTPVALTVSEQTLVGRITAGAIAALTATQVRTLINVEDGADVTDADNVNSAGATMNADSDVSGNTWVVNEDNMVSDLDTKVPTQQSVKAYADTMLPLAGGTMAGDIAMADNNINRAVLKDYGEDMETDATSTDAKTLDIAAEGNVFDITLTDNCTFTFSNPSASGTACSFTLILRQDGTGSRTVTWPASVDWPTAGTAPTLSSGAGDVDIFTFLTVDAGTTWLGMTAGLDFASPV